VTGEVNIPAAETSVILPSASPRRRTLRLRASGGWTLIELLTVISIIVLLAGMALAGYRNSIIRAQEAALKENLFRMRDAIDQYYADKGKYPPDLQALVSEGYLRKIPEDPFTRSADTWQAVPAEPDPNNPTADLGVFDVKSGSDQTSMDGTVYAEW
jgi:general secretion pathway protein G